MLRVTIKSVAYVTDKFDEVVTGLLTQGGIGVLPTDTIYGLSCGALEEFAVEKIRRLKGRDTKKSFIVLISGIEMLNMLSIPHEQALPVKQYWPGKLSVVLNARAAPGWLHKGTGTLAVRIPNYPELVTLIEKTGPLISTSVNLADQPPAKNINDANKIFGNKLDFYLDAGELNSPPSTLAGIQGGNLKIIRPGAVKID